MHNLRHTGLFEYVYTVLLATHGRVQGGPQCSQLLSLPKYRNLPVRTRRVALGGCGDLPHCILITPTFCRGLPYVMLSRVTNMRFLSIVTPLTPADFAPLLCLTTPVCKAIIPVLSQLRFAAAVPAQHAPFLIPELMGPLKGSFQSCSTSCSTFSADAHSSAHMSIISCMHVSSS